MALKEYHFKRYRSDFWVNVYYNEDNSYNISTGNRYVKLINFFFPVWKESSPTKWKSSANYLDSSNIWLPVGCYEQEDIDEFINWCKNATENVLWLYLNQNIEDYFYDELDYCIACDFNFVHGNGRTELGEAEYQLKYNAKRLEQDDIDDYFDTVMDKMLAACEYLPFNNALGSWFVSPMPADMAGREKFAWNLAFKISQELDISFVNADLINSKPYMKNVSVKDKIEFWKDIYYNGEVQIDKDVAGKNVLVIDDLYQSGATIWQYASYLKSKGARKVYGLVCVKALRDSDNL